MKHLFAAASLFLPLLVSTASAGTRKVDAKFERADIDNDNRLSPTEFRATQSRKLSEVASRVRFNAADVSNNAFVDLVEFRASRAGVAGGNPSRAEVFALADLDDDGALDPAEYAATLGRLTGFPQALKAFDKRDKDDNGELSAREFGLRRLPV